MSDNADMKMADVFNLPLTHDEVLVVDDKSIKGDLLEADKAAARAINTHDTLTAENKALRESLSGLLAAINYQGHDAADRVDAMEELARAALKLGEGL